MDTIDNFTQRLGRWLDRFGFFDDPFAIYEADQEGPTLHNFFVDRPYLHNIIGVAAHAQAAFLLAGKGEGKTATREMVAYECEHGRLCRRALPVRYNDFSSVLDEAQGDPERVGVLHHARAMARLTLKAMADEVPATCFDLLPAHERSLLQSCAAQYADSLTQFKLRRLAPADPLPLDWTNFYAREILHILVSLVTQLGNAPDQRYEAIYVLVDRVDETSAGSQAAVPLLRPLVAEGPVLEMPHIGFKFFLSAGVGDQLRRSIALRPDRVVFEAINWDGESLRHVTEQRLLYFSNNKVLQFEDLCSIAIRPSAMDRMIQTCDGSPRTLIRMCKTMIQHHNDRRDVNDLLNRDDLDEALNLKQRIDSGQDNLPLALRPAPSGPVAPPDRGLLLDDNGHVWIDGRQLVPPLTDLEHRLLRALFIKSPNIVPHEELIKAVWSSSNMVDDQNLRKLVDRVRRRLELEGSGLAPRFIQNARGRGYWLNAL